MSAQLVVRRLNTGYLESMAGVSLMAEGRHPAVPGSQIKSYGWREDILRPDGTRAAGTMVPAPAWLLTGLDANILVDTGTGKAEEVIYVQSRYGMSLATVTGGDFAIEAQLD